MAPAPIAPLIDRQGVVILDGGLATELERRGHDLDHPLWSARLLASHPDAIRAVHRAYLDAGADCLITATYQATLQGFIDAGRSRADARTLLLSAVELALAARDDWRAANPNPGRGDPLVAGSIGPYGAVLANGAEYRGDYDLSTAALRSFHRPRWDMLVDSRVDLLACETLPCIEEVEILLDLLSATPHRWAWVSVTCRDGAHLRDGTPLAGCARRVAEVPNVIALGINCTAPRHLPGLIDAARSAAPDLTIAVYPNSGETYDPATRSWRGPADPADFGPAALSWRAAGATLIGGCCRTTPAHIAAVRHALLPPR